MNLNDQKIFIESLANAIDLEKHKILAGSVFFHGTPIPEMGVSLNPTGLAGDKWFTTYQDYAKDYAELGKTSPGAVFRLTIKEDLFVVKQIRAPADATTKIGPWAGAVMDGIPQYGYCGQAIERAYIRHAIQIRFGHSADVVGLYKKMDSVDELFLLDCGERICNVEIV